MADRWWACVLALLITAATFHPIECTSWIFLQQFLLYSHALRFLPFVSCYYLCVAHCSTEHARHWDAWHLCLAMIGRYTAPCHHANLMVWKQNSHIRPLDVSGMQTSMSAWVGDRIVVIVGACKKGGSLLRMRVPSLVCSCLAAKHS